MRCVFIAGWFALILATLMACKVTPSTLYPVGGSDEGMNLFDDD